MIITIVAHVKSAHHQRKGTGIFNSSGEHWKIQRQAAMVFASPKVITHTVNVTLPRFLSAFFEPLDAAARNEQVIDFEETTFEFTMAHFGHIAFAVSGSSSVSVFIKITGFRRMVENYQGCSAVLSIMPKRMS